MVTSTIGNSFRLWGNDSFVCVQDAIGRGPLLKIQWVGTALPSHIEAAIRYAHANGWQLTVRTFYKMARTRM